MAFGVRPPGRRRGETLAGWLNQGERVRFPSWVIAVFVDGGGFVLQGRSNALRPRCAGCGSARGKRARCLRPGDQLRESSE